MSVTPPDLDKLKQQLIPVLQAYGVTRSSIFGSFARGETTAQSDLDILVDFPFDQKSGFEFVRLADSLQKATARRVDLVTFASLHPYIRDQVLAQQIPIL